MSDGREQAPVCEHYTMSDGSALRASLEVELVRAGDTQYGHNEIQSYAIHGLHISMYTVQILWCVWFDLARR